MASSDDAENEHLCCLYDCLAVAVDDKGSLVLWQNPCQSGRYKTQVTGHRSGHRAQVTGYRSGHRSQGTGHRAQVTGHRAQVTGHRAQVTGHRAQGTGHRKRSKNS